MVAVRSCFLLFLLAAALLGTACREEGDIKVSDLQFNGVEQVDKSALRSALQTKKGSWIPWGRKRYFDRRAFEADLKRIEAFYRDRGFPDARVASFDVALNSAQDEVDITVTISEGEPIRVAAIDLTGFGVLDAADLEMLQETMPLRIDEPLDRQLALAARERALNELRDHGYPYAEVTVTEHPAGPRRQRVVLHAVPGTLAHFGAVEINGAVSVSENVIRRQLTFEPGDLFTRREMRESQRKLYGLELFEFVNVESREEVVPQSPTVPVRVTVAEGKHRKVTFGAGYGTEERARARLRWDHVNFFGGARHAGLEGKWSSLDRGVRAEYREPFFLRPHFSLSFDGQAWQAAEPVYSLNSLGGRVTLRHQANQQNFWAVSVINEYQRSTVTREALEDFSIRDELIALGLDPRDGHFAGTLSALTFDISRNTANNILDARSGYVLNAHLEQAGRWMLGSFNYWSANGEARHYLSILRKAVFANRLRVGAIDAVGDLAAGVPFYKRYFLGGSSSLRGWGRFEVGPVSGFGLPIGGHTMLEGSSEARVPLWGKLGAVAFVDYGNVWSRPWDFNLDDLRYAVGPGLRYLTPIGPARVDFGYQLNPIENLRVNGEPQRRHWRVHFSIGQAF
jgi:outer membrane protein insertion porin family/translocation and assembly module TamA